MWPTQSHGATRVIPTEKRSAADLFVSRHFQKHVSAHAVMSLSISIAWIHWFKFRHKVYSGIIYAFQSGPLGKTRSHNILKISIADRVESQKPPENHVFFQSLPANSFSWDGALEARKLRLHMLQQRMRKGSQEIAN